MYDIRSLETFSFLDENGKDQGINSKLQVKILKHILWKLFSNISNYKLKVRVKAKEIVEFVQDDEKLREERKKAKKNKDKYVGINSNGAGFGSMSSSKSSYSDFSSSRNTNNMDDLNDKDWRTNKSSSIQERITNITSKVKNIIDNAPDDEKNVSDEENDQNETYNELGFENKPKKESASNKVRYVILLNYEPNSSNILTDRIKVSYY